MSIFAKSTIVIVSLVLIPVDVVGRPTENAGDKLVNLLLRALDNENSAGNQVTGNEWILRMYCIDTKALVFMFKVEHNSFPHGVFLIKILTILLLGHLKCCTSSALPDDMGGHQCMYQDLAFWHSGSIYAVHP